MLTGFGTRGNMFVFFRHVAEAIAHYQYWMGVSLITTLANYRQSLLGPVWIALSIGLFIFILGNLYAMIWHVDTAIYLPFLAAGYIIWHMMSGAVSLGVKLYNSNKSYILQSRMPLPSYSMKMLFEVLIIMAHNMLVYALVAIYYGAIPGFVHFLLFILGLFLLLTNMVWVSTLLGIFGAAYKDVVEVVNVLMRVAFLATPILWMPHSINDRPSLSIYLTMNPFYHFLEITRTPLLGQMPNIESWYAAISITIVGFLLTNFIYARFYKKIPLWL